MKNNRKIGAHVSTSGGLNTAIINTQEIGGNCLQIFAGSPRMWARSLFAEKIAKEFKEIVVVNSLNPVYIHALYLTNLASDNPEILSKSIKAITIDLKNSSAIGSAGVILHIGSHQGRGWEADKHQVINSIKKILDDTPSDSTLVLENSAGQKGKIGALTELKDILGSINDSRLKICLDTAHAFEAGYNISTFDGIEKWIDEIEATITLTKVELFHLNDSKTPLGSGRDNHENIGDGYIGLEGIKLLINHPKFSHLPLILEVPGIDGFGPDRENIERLKRLIA